MIRIDSLRKAPVKIDDLGITVYPGQAEWIEKDRALGSACLNFLTHSGYLQVSYGSRCRVSNPPPKQSVPFVTLSRPSPKPLRTAPEKTEPSADSLKAVALEAVRLALASAPKQELPDLEKMIERAVAKALASSNLSRPESITRTEGPEEPVYIPSDIVGSEKVTVVTTSESSDNKGLDEATQTLKALKSQARKSKTNDVEK